MHPQSAHPLFKTLKQAFGFYAPYNTPNCVVCWHAMGEFTLIPEPLKLGDANHRYGFLAFGTSQNGLHGEKHHVQ
jgi:hypothetical protein